MDGQLRITEMFAFIVIDDDGTEGIPAFQAPNGMAMPMVGADLERIDSMKPIALTIGKPVTIARFSNRTDIEILNKGEVQ